jgi:hypothetical protein
LFASVVPGRSNLADNIPGGAQMLRNRKSFFSSHAKLASSVHEQQDFRYLYTDPAISYSKEYAEIPEPKAKLSPEMLAVKWARGDLHGEDMPSLAADLLESGKDTPSLRRLAGEMHVACSADVEEIVGRMFRELGVAYPISVTEALAIYSRQVAREVIHGYRNAWAAASHLVKGIWPRKHENPDIRALSELLDSLDWNAVNQGTLPTLTAELIEVFARLGAPTDREKRMIHFGALKGRGWIADDFDAPLADDLLAQFEGRDKPDWF